MSIKTREELLESIKARVGENTDDETIAFLEDITDTLSDYEEKIKGDGVDWKSKYEENDKMWRQKYTDRFFNGDTDKPYPEEPKPEDEKKMTSFEDLFSAE